MEFAERLKQAMDIRGKKASDVALACGISKGLLSKYLSGKTVAKQKNIYAIAHYLSVSPSFLMGFQDSVLSARKESTSAVRNSINERLDGMSEAQLKKVLKFIEEFL